MPKRAIYSDDDFEQFDDAKPSRAPQEDEPLESYRTRQSYTAKVVEPITIPHDELRRKINARAINYLSRREYSRTELYKKLSKAFENYTSDDAHAQLIGQVLDELHKNNWQSDKRYAAQMSKVKGEKFGVARLKHEFKQSGLSEDLVEQELALLKSTELERARVIWLRKFGSPPVDLKEKAKQARFMASRGFCYEIVSQIIKGLENE